MTEVAVAKEVGEVELEMGSEGAQGVLGEHTVVPCEEAPETTAGVFAFLLKANSTPLPDGCNFEAVWVTGQVLEVEQQIGQMLEDLARLPDGEKGQTKAAQLSPARPDRARGDAPSPFKSTHVHAPQLGKEKHDSIFSLARSVHSQKSEGVQVGSKYTFEPEKVTEDKTLDREGRGGQHQEQQEEQKKKKGKYAVPKVSASTGKSKTYARSESGGDSIGNIYIRFMQLMAQILGQAEADAHELYQRIKARTDQVDLLTQLMGKINSTTGDIDWSKDPQMRALVDKARALGVEIPEGKYSWNEEEKRLLKENIQMKKDSFEKITQLERTDMQRYLQEASQCHQARSNVLKLLKEVMDTIIHNFRP